MRRNPPVSLLALLFVFSSFAMAEAQSDSGLEGVVSISPIHGGPARIGVPNSRPLGNTAFIVKKGDETVTSFTTDDQGHFKVPLQPGHYTISMKDGRPKIGMRGSFEADVIAGQFKQVQWTCDSGMR